jgi:hypothetical protein
LIVRLGLVILASILKTEIGTSDSKNRSIQFAHSSTAASFPLYSAMTRPLSRWSVFDESKLALADTMPDVTAARGKANRKAANKYAHLSC